MLDGAPPAPDPAVARRLRDRLAALAVAIDDVDGKAADVALPSYPGGPRPSSTVVLSGRGAAGRGENVAWTTADHARFLERCRTDRLRGRRSIGDLSRALRDELSEPYDCAAFEAAAIDLALRQAGASLPRLAEATPRPVRYVVSLARARDPAAAVQSEIALRRDLELKLDVDPEWSAGTLAAIARAASVAVLDWKGAGTAADVARLAATLPHALHEDPPGADLADGTAWPEEIHGRISLDQCVRRAGDLRAIPRPPAAVNVKPARMGGVLDALDALAACGERAIGAYLGGMFEIGAGRAQLLALAALLCPESPNDIAPIARAGEAPRRPERLSAPTPGEPGFG